MNKHGGRKDNSLSRKADQVIAVIVLCVLCLGLTFLGTSQLPSTDVRVSDARTGDYDREVQKAWEAEEAQQAKNARELDEPSGAAAQTQMQRRDRATIHRLTSELREARKVSEKRASVLQRKTARFKGKIKQLQEKLEQVQRQDPLPKLFVTQHTGSTNHPGGCNLRHSFEVHSITSVPKIPSFSSKFPQTCVLFRGERADSHTYIAVTSSEEALRSRCSHPVPAGRPIVLQANGTIYVKVCRPCGSDSTSSPGGSPGRPTMDIVYAFSVKAEQPNFKGKGAGAKPRTASAQVNASPANNAQAQLLEESWTSTESSEEELESEGP